MPTLFLALTTTVDWKYSTGIMENIDARTQENLEMCKSYTANEWGERLHPAGRLVASEDMFRSDHRKTTRNLYWTATRYNALSQQAQVS